MNEDLHFKYMILFNDCFIIIVLLNLKLVIKQEQTNNLTINYPIRCRYRTNHIALETQKRNRRCIVGFLCLHAINEIHSRLFATHGTCIDISLCYG